jgi:hypothetical protein
MPSEQKAKKFASVVLTKKHVSIAEEIVTRHLDAAMAAKDRDRTRELSALLNIIDEVKTETEAE